MVSADENSVYAFDMHLYLLSAYLELPLSGSVSVSRQSDRFRRLVVVNRPPVEDGSNPQMLPPRRAETERRSDGVLRAGDIDAVDIGSCGLTTGWFCAELSYAFAATRYQHQGESEQAGDRMIARAGDASIGTGPSSCRTYGYSPRCPPAETILEDCPAAGFAISVPHVRNPAPLRMTGREYWSLSPARASPVTVCRCCSGGRRPRRRQQQHKLNRFRPNRLVAPAMPLLGPPEIP